MKNILLKLSLFVLCFLLVLNCTACGHKRLNAHITFDGEHSKSSSDSYVAAENEQYSLQWNKEKLRIELYDKLHDVLWTNAPADSDEVQYDEFGMEVQKHPKLDTSIILEYIETENYNIKTANAYTACLKKGSYDFEKIDNGFRITYYFDSLEISFPVEYTLNDDGFSVSVISDQIAENGTTALAYRIVIEPFLCSVKIGADSENNYLFFPSGTGALMYADTSSDVSISYSENVYGGDKLLDEYSNIVATNSENIMLPVYGAKTGNTLMMGVITEGADVAAIDGDIANNTIGYSAVYSAFRVRTQERITAGGPFSRETEYSDEFTTSPMQVTFYPLYDEDADYSGMANKYREYLIKKYNITPNDSSDSLAVKLIGGTQIATSFLGIPTTEVFATTTVKEASNIISDIKSSTNANLVADLVGFGQTGIDVGKVGGNFKLAGSIGNKNQMKSLSSDCESLGVDLYFDYDVLRFNTSGRGLSCRNDGPAISTQYQNVKVFNYSLGNGSVMRNSFCYLTSRTLLSKFVDMAVKNAKSMKLKGVAFDTLSNYVYCDFRDNKYVACGSMGTDVVELFNNAKASEMSVLSNAPNEYAAASSNCVLDIPTSSSKNYLFDEEVPFYGLVFKGILPMYTRSVNLTTDKTLQKLKSIEMGASLSYTLTNTYDVDLMKSATQVFSNTVYDDIKNDIVENYNSTSEYYKAISGATILENSFVNSFVKKTEFSNGYVVYVNYGNQSYESPLGTVEAESFVFGKEGNN